METGPGISVLFRDEGIAASIAVLAVAESTSFVFVFIQYFLARQTTANDKMNVK